MTLAHCRYTSKSRTLLLLASKVGRSVDSVKFCSLNTVKKLSSLAVMPHSPAINGSHHHKMLWEAYHLTKKLQMPVILKQAINVFTSVLLSLWWSSTSKQHHFLLQHMCYSVKLLQHLIAFIFLIALSLLSMILTKYYCDTLFIHLCIV